MRKMIAILLVIVLEITCLTGCGGTQATEKETKIAITPENYEEYFNIKFNCDSQINESPVSGTWFHYNVTATCRSTVTASFSHVELTGKVHLPVDQETHLLYTENKLPLDMTIVIDGNGFGEETVRFQHGTGSYGGFSTGDFYFECTSASGYIELR